MRQTVRPVSKSSAVTLRCGDGFGALAARMADLARGFTAGATGAPPSAKNTRPSAMEMDASWMLPPSYIQRTRPVAVSQANMMSDTTLVLLPVPMSRPLVTATWHQLRGLPSAAFGIG